MKKLLASFSILLMLCGTAFAQEKDPTIKEYMQVLVGFSNMVQKFDQEELYKDVVFENKETKEKIKFQDLSKLQKFVFMFGQGEKITTSMTALDEAWNRELRKLKNRPPEPEPPTEPEPPSDEDLNIDPSPVKEDPKEEKKKEPTENDAATVANVERFIEDLTVLRKKMAVKYEKFMNSNFTEFKDKLPKHDVMRIKKSVREYHDKHNLIKR